MRRTSSGSWLLLIWLKSDKTFKVQTQPCTNSQHKYQDQQRETSSQAASLKYSLCCFKSRCYRNCTALNNLCLFATFPCGWAQRLVIIYAHRTLPVSKGRSQFAQTVCQPLQRTVEAFSGWLRRVGHDERVAPRGSPAKCMRREPAEIQIAAVREGSDSFGLFGLFNLYKMTRGGFTVVLNVYLYHISANLQPLVWAGYWIGAVLNCSGWNINRSNDLQTGNTPECGGVLSVLSDGWEEPPFCGQERGNSGCWVQISNSGFSFQSDELQGFSQEVILNVKLLDSW